jgi:dipeptide/tripeptide permease
MYWQLFYTLPVYIEQWIDLELFYRRLYQFWPWLADFMGTGKGSIASEMIVNADAFYIILFQVAVSAWVMRFKPLMAMMAGIVVCSAGMGLALLTRDPFIMTGSLLIFALGEMSASPKVTEYIGKIAPAGKVALYMGFSFFPLFIGNIVSGWISGPVYQRLSDKLTLLQYELTARGISVRQPDSGFTLNDFYSEASSKLNMSTQEMTQFLWDKYQPDQIWLIITGLGVFTACMLFVYDRVIVRFDSSKI